MTAQREDIEERLRFIDRTIVHAARACQADGRVPSDLKHCVDELEHYASEAKQAWHALDVPRTRRTVENLARLSDHAQSAFREDDDMDHVLKSAVILTHIEVSALRYQLA
ncbi:hypothetical protein [Noviherbaspirillum galbum]|uniref:Uncharacterized protein n=1 Tax=Noviherbaspirillum galbum TaxID=2709383 RepID=A0A6B3SZN0_9BURK|nr:hypothetical protein [Noviherbaspirillum galbum]NEX64289.1 hypothetical protein [Noviherbaspirillum galbum]